MHGPLPEATQSTTVYIKFRPPVSGLPPSVKAQISATRASTSVIFASGPRYCTLTVAIHWPHMVHVDLCEIFECARLKFTVSGWSKQASIDRYTHVRNAVTLVWGGSKGYSKYSQKSPETIGRWGRQATTQERTREVSMSLSPWSGEDCNPIPFCNLKMVFMQQQVTPL